MKSDSQETTPAPAAPGLGAALGIHLGLLVLVGSALVSRQVPPLNSVQVAMLVAVGLALVVWALVEQRQGTVSLGLRAAVGLGAVLLLGLARGPRLDRLWGAEASGSLISYLRLDLGTVAVAIMFVFWLGYLIAGGEIGQRAAPLRRSVALSAGLVIGLAAILYIALQPLYGAAEELGTGRLIFQTLELAALLVVVLGSVGGRRVGRWPVYYVGAALLVAGILNAFAGGGALP